MLVIRNIILLFLVLFALTNTQILEPDAFKDKILSPVISGDL
jgi:hypothetical protein